MLRDKFLIPQHKFEKYFSSVQAHRENNFYVTYCLFIIYTYCSKTECLLKASLKNGVVCIIKERRAYLEPALKGGYSRIWMNNVKEEYIVSLHIVIVYGQTVCSPGGKEVILVEAL